MDYLAFNKWAYNYYKKTTPKNGECCLAIDEHEIEIFRMQHNLKDLKFIEINKLPWSQLLSEHNYGNIIIPKYFGLIALQCLAAFLMEENDHIHSSNYNQRFCEISGIDIKVIQQKYSEEFKYKKEAKWGKIQEIIWEKAEDYFQNKLQYKITIPPTTHGTGRYTQFPKYQAVLNKQDLKEIGENILMKLSILDEGISEGIFKNQFKILYRTAKLIRPHNKYFFSNKYQPTFLKQVFNYYNSRQWLNEEKNIIKQTKNKNAYIRHAIELINDQVYIYNGNQEILSLKNILPNNSLLLFKKIDNQNEYDQTSVIKKDDEIIIISNLNLNFGITLKHNFNQVFIKKIKLESDKDIPEILWPYLRYNPDFSEVKLQGIRVKHSHCYVKNFGPEIIGEKFHLYYSSFENDQFQLEINNYNSLNCQQGIYTIRVPGYRDKTFYIIEENTKIEIQKQGLNLTNFKIEKESENPILHGIQLIGNQPRNNNKKLTINNWIKANTRVSSKTNHPLLKAIKISINDGR